MKLTDIEQGGSFRGCSAATFLPTLGALVTEIVPRATGIQAPTSHASRRLDPKGGGLTMSIPAQKHGHRWKGYVAVTIIVVAAAVLAWMFLKDSARILRDWQMGRW